MKDNDADFVIWRMRALRESVDACLPRCEAVPGSRMWLVGISDRIAVLVDMVRLPLVAHRPVLSDVQLELDGYEQRVAWVESELVIVDEAVVHTVAKKHTVPDGWPTFVATMETYKRFEAARPGPPASDCFYHLDLVDHVCVWLRIIPRRYVMPPPCMRGNKAQWFADRSHVWKPCPECVKYWEAIRA